jgi:hypothetical protein
LDPALVAFIEKAGLLTYAGCMTWWAYTLWNRLKDKDGIIAALNAGCLACAKAQSEKLLAVGTGAVQALEKNTEALAALRRQEDILKRLDDLQPYGPRAR